MLLNFCWVQYVINVLIKPGVLILPFYLSFNQCLSLNRYGYIDIAFLHILAVFCVENIL